MSHEDRESEEQGLNELPEDLLKERGEIYPPEISYREPKVPHDLASSVDLGDAPTLLEDRTQGASVRSVYDTRPINGTDFQSAESQDITPSAENGGTVDFNYTVPTSYIAVLRGFEFRQSPVKIVEDLDISFSILVDGISQLGHSNIPLPPDVGFINTHILADENSTITLRVIYPALYSDAVLYRVWSRLYGNLILTNNRPLAFEVGNTEPVKTIPVPPGVNTPSMKAPTAQKGTPQSSQPVPAKQYKPRPAAKTVQRKTTSNFLLSKKTGMVYVPVKGTISKRK